MIVKRHIFTFDCIVKKIKKLSITVKIGYNYSVSVGMSYLLTSQDVQSSSESNTNALATSIDGNISTCFETNTETNPWWMIDLEREYTVFSIVLTTSQDQTGMKTNSFLL